MDLFLQKGYIVGYGAIINFYELTIPLPNVLSLTSTKNRVSEQLSSFFQDDLESLAKLAV